MPRNRTKKIAINKPVGNEYYWAIPGNPFFKTSTSNLLTSEARIIDTSHPLWNMGVRSGDIGDDARILKTTIARRPSTGGTIIRPQPSPNPGRYYVGSLTAVADSGNVAINPYSTSLIDAKKAMLDSKLASMWNQARPAKPSFTALTAIYELREVPQMLRQRFTKDLKGAGNYWLALQFGWLPLLRDIMTFVDTHFNAKKILDQLMRDEGRPVRRGAGLWVEPPTVKHAWTGESYGAFEQVFVTQAYKSKPRYQFTHTYSEKAWLSARFRYWLPPGPRDWRWKAWMLARIYGLNPRPIDVYNAIPWSWLVDWFSNLGDVIENISGGVEDRLAADYAYGMIRATSNCIMDVTGEFNGPGSSTSVHSAQTTYTTSVYHRVRASPFGFSLQDSQLSLMQWSILGALGASKSRPWRT